MTSAHQNFEGVPHIDQYLGAWAMYEPNALALLEHARQLDLHLHLAGHGPAAARMAADNAGFEVTPGGVAIVELHGTMMKHVSSMTAGTSTVLARKMIRAAAAREDVSAILLHVDSPGGTAAGTQDLATDIAAAAKQKPVIAFIEDLGASAAFWAASQASKVIAANDSTLVGSIGTFTVVYDYSGMAAKEGIKAHVIRAGQFKGMGTPGTEVTGEQLAELQRIISGINSTFLQGVSIGRKLDMKTVETLADGRVHPATEAKRLGLIDAVQSLDATLAELSVPRSSKSKTMSKESTAIEATAELVDPIASFQDLKAALPGASSDFICKMLDGKKTVAEATKDFLAHQQSEIEAANKRAADAEAAAKATAAKPGVEPLTSKATEKTEASGAGFWSIVAEHQKAGMTRDKAIAKAVKENPEAHSQMIEEANANRKK